MKAERGMFRMIRRNELRPERVHDSYKWPKKPAEPTRCPDCGAVFSAGRWAWGQAPAGAHEALCPACHRVRDRFPAGFVSLGGAFFAAHRDEILNRVRSCEAREKAEHPLERLVSVEDQGQGALVTTTSIHLARAIGDALHDAWKGELEFHYNEAENLLRVNWSREA
jgi:hypothetical protein